MIMMSCRSFYLDAFKIDEIVSLIDLLEEEVFVHAELQKG